jgi:tetratricopeptide (TPR) repeat protein/tRNA A-37 threonylcarbamoyl transferase component Bud32
MSAPQRTAHPADRPDSAQLWEALERFEKGWQTGPPPTLEAFLPPDAAGRRAALAQLAAVDLEYRLKAGEPVRVEAYAQRYAELAGDREAVLALIAVEYEHRRRSKARVDVHEYVRRFPEHAQDLQRRWAVPASADTNAVAGRPTQPGVAAADSQATRLTEEPPAAAPAGSVPTVPGYEVLEEIGRGGMGVVYKARHVSLQRLVALKMIRAGELAGAAERARFRTEAEAVARLQHPHIVQIYEVGEAGSRPFCALEFVEGGSLDNRLAGTPLPPGPAAQLVGVLARAVHAAHQRGVVHRDLKPANILLQSKSESRNPKPESAAGSAFGFRLSDFEPKITDFGLAKRLDQRHAQTESGVVVGTPSYMAPEQARGEPGRVGPAADVYALGAILYELLTGRPPFRAATPLDTVLQVLSEEPVPPARLNKQVPRDLETVCLKCLRKLPGQRYASGLELAEDLRRFREGRAIAARPTPWWERAGKWARRRPAVAALVAVSALAAVSLFTVITVYTFQLREAVDAEARRRQQARDALDAMSSQVIEQWLAKQKELLPEHKAFLRKALALYEELAGDTDQDEKSRAGVAKAFLRVAVIRARLGEAKDAEAAFRRSQQLYERLAADLPNRPDYRQQQANSHNNLGNLLADTGQSQGAESAYRTALALLKQLASDFPNEPAYRKDLAGSYVNLGNLLNATGRPKQAERVYGAALALNRQLAEEFPNRPDFRQQLATNYNARGTLLHTAGRSQEAEVAYRAALVLQKRLAADFPNRPDLRHALAHTHNNLGLLLAKMGRPPKAEAAYRDAVALYQQLAGDFPNRPDYRRQLASCQDSLGLLLAETGRPKEAEAAYRAALGVHKQLATELLNQPDYRQALARSHNNLGILLAQTGRTREAESPLRESLAHKKKLALDFPTRPQYREELADGHNNLANVLADTGRYQQAKAAYGAALVLYRHLARDLPANADYQNGLAAGLVGLAVVANAQRRYADSCRRLAQALAHTRAALRANPGHPYYRAVLHENGQALAQARLGLGEHAAAAAAAEEMVRIGYDPVNDPYQAACILAGCVPLAEKDAKLPESRRPKLSQDYAERAMTLLRQAVAKGYKDAAQMKKDKDLAPLRSRPDFQILLTELEQKKTNAAKK